MTMLSVLACSVNVAQLPSAQFYGPALVELPIQTTGNPFDPAENDVRVRFISGKGQVTERLGYYSHGKWYVKLVTDAPGTFAGTIILNGKDVARLSERIKITQPLQEGFITKDGAWFKTTTGKPFWPIGINLAWKAGSKTIPQQMVDMSNSGMNWTRVWACHWDDRNPYWLQNKPNPKDNWMSEDALDNWEEVVRNAEKNRLKFQFVFFHHGQFSTSVNPNWQDHPWNAAKGGFLKKPQDFFTDPEAKRRARMFLRAAVARWGDSPSIMAWELFNEVQFVDKVRVDQDWKTVGEWHDEMANYLRSIDPYKHLVTTSSELQEPIWRKMDYLQGHGYPSSISGMLLGTAPLKDRPLFYGEVGPGDGPAPDLKVVIRDSIWSGFFAGHSGAGEYWYWDQMYKPGLYDEYKRNIGLIASLRFPSAYKRINVMSETDTPGKLAFAPGRGWASTSFSKFNLPADASSDKTGQLSSFVQGTQNRKMQPDPIEFNFSAKTAGTFRMHASQLSEGGSHLILSLNGTMVTEKKFDGSANKGRINEWFEVPYAAGKVNIKVENNGLDWLNIDRYEFSNLSSGASVLASQSTSDVVMRAQFEKAGASVRLKFGSVLKAGKTYKGEAMDLATGKKKAFALKVTGASANYTSSSTDELIKISLK